MCIVAVAAVVASIYLPVATTEHPDSDVTVVASRRATAAPGPGAELARNYGDIAGWHLFGKVPVAPPSDADDQEAPPDGVPDGPLPRSEAPIRLTGVVYSPDGRATLAIIADAQKVDKTYAVGDTLPGDIELHRIERTRIVVQRKGRFEEVPLPRLGSDGGRTVAPDQRQHGVRSRPRATKGRPLANTSPTF